MINLDTHMLLDFVAGVLRQRERELMEHDNWSISSVVLWEIAKLAQLGRIQLNLETEELVTALDRIHVWPIDVDIARASARLDFRSDPADEIIAATSIVHNVPLLTRDRLLQQSTVVPLVAVT